MAFVSIWAQSFPGAIPLSVLVFEMPSIRGVIVLLFESNIPITLLIYLYLVPVEPTRPLIVGLPEA